MSLNYGSQWKAKVGGGMIFTIGQVHKIHGTDHYFIFKGGDSRLYTEKTIRKYFDEITVDKPKKMK